MAIIVEHKNLRTNLIKDINGDTRMDFSGVDSIINAPTGGDIVSTINAILKTRFDEDTSALKIFSGNSAGGSTNIVREVTAQTTNSGTGVHTFVSGRPVGSLILGVTIDIISTLAGSGLTTFGVGDGSDPDLYGATTAVVAGTITDMTDFTADPFEFRLTNGDVVLTADAGVFSSGNILIAVHYIDLTQLT